MLACFDKWKIASNNLDQQRPFAWRSEYIFLVLRPTRPIRAKDRIASLRHRIQSAQAAFRDPPSQIRQSNLQTAGAIGTRPELSTSGQPERFSRSADPYPSRQRRIQCLASVPQFIDRIDRQLQASHVLEIGSAHV